MLAIDGDTLRAIAPQFSGARWPAAQTRIITGVGDVLRPVLARYDISTRLRIAHFLAQIAHESAGFRTTQEFASGAAYEGRLDLGNTEPGDGKRFKGRGLIQLTGRANYTQMSTTLNLDLVTNPNMAAGPELSLVIACEYWISRDINQQADRDDLIAVTRLVNGGLNGLEDRRAYLVKAKAELAQLAAITIGANSPTDAKPTLRRGSTGPAVWTTQGALRERGYDLAIDGQYGPATELAVLHFQHASGLVVDGIVGPDTWRALNS